MRLLPPKMFGGFISNCYLCCVNHNNEKEMNVKIIKGSLQKYMMIRKCYLLSMVLFATTLLSGCHYSGNEYYYHELDKIDHRQNRDLARKELFQLKGQTDNCADYVKHYYMLQTLEMNNALSPERNFKAAEEVVKYYEETGDKTKLIRSYVIAGAISANCNDGPKALTYYHKAEDMLPDGVTSAHIELYDKMVQLLLRQNMPDVANRYAKRILHYAENQSDTLSMIHAMRYISQSFKMQRVPRSMLTYLNDAYVLATKAALFDEQDELRYDMACYYCDNGHYREAKGLVLPLKDKSLQGGRHKVDALLSRIYYHVGEIDSALFFAQRVMDEGNSISKRDVHEILAHIAIQQGKAAEAEDHFTRYKDLNDELNFIANNEAIAQADAFYNNQKQAEENVQLKAANNFKQTVIIIGIALVVIIIVLFATYIQRHRRRQELMEMRIQHLQQLKKNYAKTDAEEIKRAEQTIESTEIWKRLATLPDSEHPTDVDWINLSETIDEVYDGFTGRLMHLCHPSTHELHVSLLLKAGFEPVRIASLTLRSKAAISTVRSRLYEKTFGKKASAKDWDEVILTL